MTAPVHFSAYIPGRVRGSVCGLESDNSAPDLLVTTLASQVTCADCLRIDQEGPRLSEAGAR